MSLLTTLAKTPVRFSPKHVAGLGLWLAADKITGLSNNAAVPTWPDASGLARDMTQGTAGNRPTFQTGVRNGKPVVRFASASSHFMKNASAFLSGASGSVFAVVSSTTGAPTIQTLIASMDEATSNTYFCQARLQDFGAGFTTLTAQRSNDTTDSIGASTTNVALGTWYVLEYHSSGSAFEMRANGTVTAKTVHAGADNGNWFANTANKDSVSIGAQVDSGGATRFFNGDMAELVVYDGVALAVSTKARIRRYLSRRYAIAVAL